MSTLRDIRSRIQSVRNIKQITKSMEMVAASRLHKAVPNAEHASLYANKLWEMVQHIVSSEQAITNPLFAPKKSEQTVLIVVAGDTGLSGPYNSTVFSAADAFLKERDPQTTQLILFGRKAIEYYQRKPWQIIQRVENWSGKITFIEIRKFTSELRESFLRSEFHSVWFVYTHYVNPFLRNVVVDKLLNIEKPKHQHIKLQQNTIFEPNPAELLEDLLPRYCLAKMTAILYQSYASELGARVASMRAATKNAEEMIDSLILLSNKLRQSGITKEILEITSGAEAMK
jgi:F-type H+-transporting ATPase subunit gamma